MYLGNLYFTRGIQNLLDNREVRYNSIWQCVARHQRGDYGTLCEDDVEVNNMSLIHNCGTVMSQYIVDGIKVWVITNLGDSETTYTTCLLPQEY